MSRVDHVFNVAMATAREQNLSPYDMKQLQSKIALESLKSSFNEDFGYDDLDEEL
tara:strand:- start:8153 stop:8317 length:165 start_codon:yes stop_codon:yes gene_type:complete